jgi:hypothetical protein
VAGGEELEEEEPAAAGEAAELEDAALDAAFDVLVGSDGEAISQSLYGGRRGRPDSTARDFRGLSPESIPRVRHSGTKGPHGAIMLYTLTHAYAIRPRSATLSGHGHARTKAAPGLIIIQSRRATLPADPTRAFDATVRTHECQDARTHVAAPNRTGRVDSS